MKLLSTLFPQNEFIGIHLGYENSYITVGNNSTSGVKVEWQKVFSTSEHLNFNENELSHLLENIILLLPEKFKKQYLPVQIALPDPLFKTQKLQFSSFPRSYKEQSTLVNWQLAKVSHCIAEEIYTTWQLLGSIGQEQCVFAYGLDKIIVDTLKRVMHISGLQLSSVNAASFFRYNILNAEALSKSGVLLALEKDYWSLMFWNKAGDLDHIHTATRESNTSDDIEGIVAETERLVLSYIHNSKNVENIYITAMSEEKEILETQINQHLKHKCKWLSVLDVSNAKFNDSGVVDLATIIKP